MKRIVLAGVALAALMGGSAMAADMGAPLYKAPPPAPPAFSWTGWYLGTHTGIVAGRTTTRNVAPYGGFDAGIPLSYDVNPVSIFGGGQIGYNWQLGSILLGAEIDGGYLGVRESQRPAPDDLVQVKYGWYGTFTARGGFVYDRLLTYVKGGAAVASIRNTASDLDGAGAIDPTDFSQTNSTRWGWTVGTGFEYALLPNWTVKSEYLYMDFGTKSSSNLDGDVFQHQNRLQTFKIGLNYKWGGSLMSNY
jgi:outer membrane immunogenic protein